MSETPGGIPKVEQSLEWGIFGQKEDKEFHLLTVDVEPTVADMDLWLNCWWTVMVTPGNSATMTFDSLVVRSRYVNYWVPEGRYPFGSVEYPEEGSEL
jgi:hypothetical protein